MIKNSTYPVFLESSVSFPIYIKTSTKAISSDRIISSTFSTFVEKPINSVLSTLREYVTKINTIIQEYSTQRCKTQPKLQSVKTSCEIFKKQVLESKHLNGYHRHQLINKLAEVSSRIQNYEVSHRIKERRLLTNKQPKITSFLKEHVSPIY